MVTGIWSSSAADLLIFVAFALFDNIAGAIGRYPRIEPYGFVGFLGALGYVAARQTLERDQQLNDIQKELEVARRIQLSILPGEFPASAAFRVAARYVPMTSVAGDFYDFIVADEKQAGLLIADVSGHGVPAALIASMVKLAATAQRSNAGRPFGTLVRDECGVVRQYAESVRNGRICSPGCRVARSCGTRPRGIRRCCCCGMEQSRKCWRTA